MLLNARTDRLATAVLASQGGKDVQGRDIQIVDPGVELRTFLIRLHEPLTAEAEREAMMKEVRS